MKLLLTSISLTAVVVLTSAISPIIAQDEVGNGGIGGRPAFPREDNPRSNSIFVHTIEGGDRVEDGVNIINNSAETKQVVVYAADSIISSGGAFACEQRVDPVDDVGSWITLEKDTVELASTENEVIPFTIDVPILADVGEHDACIVIQEQLPEADVNQGIGLSFRTAIRVAILVPGEIQKGLSIDRVEADIADTVILRPVITNSGNVSVDAQIDSTLSTLWGRGLSTVGGEYPVLREQTGEWNFEHEKPFWGGWYRTKVAASYDSNVANFIGGDDISLAVLEQSGPTIFIFPQVGALLAYLLMTVLFIMTIRSYIATQQQKRVVEKEWKNHKVRKGEDLQFYAQETGTSWKDIARVNKIKPPYSLEIGQSLKLPPKKPKK